MATYGFFNLHLNISTRALLQIARFASSFAVYYLYTGIPILRGVVIAKTKDASVPDLHRMPRPVASGEASIAFRDLRV